MKPNPKHYELRICVESIHKGYSREIRWAQKLKKEIFDSDEEFCQYFGLKIDAPVMAIICEDLK